MTLMLMKGVTSRLTPMKVFLPDFPTFSNVTP